MSLQIRLWLHTLTPTHSHLLIGQSLWFSSVIWMLLACYHAEQISADFVGETLSYSNNPDYFQIESIYSLYSVSWNMFQGNGNIKVRMFQKKLSCLSMISYMFIHTYIHTLFRHFTTILLWCEIFKLETVFWGER